MGMLSLLLGRDQMGHTLGINYKGNDSHPSVLGAVLTLGIQIVVLIQLI